MSDTSGVAPGVSKSPMEGDIEPRAALRRARNRVAASKCRARKSIEIANLETDMKCLRDRRLELAAHAEDLRNRSFILKNQLFLPSPNVTLRVPIKQISPGTGVQAPASASIRHGHYR